MLWRFGMGCAGVVAGFFALTLIWPLSTMGDPAYDIPMLRARWYGGFYIFVPHLLAGLVAGALAVRHRSPWALASAVLSMAAFWVIFTEEARFIRFGDLILPAEATLPRLWLSKIASFGLSLTALTALWRGHARH